MTTYETLLELRDQVISTKPRTEDIEYLREELIAEGANVAVDIILNLIDTKLYELRNSK